MTWRSWRQNRRTESVVRKCICGIRCADEACLIGSVTPPTQTRAQEEAFSSRTGVRSRRHGRRHHRDPAPSLLPSGSGCQGDRVVGSRSRRAVESVFGDMFIHAVCLFAYTPSVDFFCDDAVKTTTQRPGWYTNVLLAMSSCGWGMVWNALW